MGIRSKFLVILLIFCVVPLLCYYLINQWLFEKLGDDVYHIATVLMLQTTAKELQNASDNYSINLDREFDLLEKHLESGRDNIEKLALQASFSSGEEENRLKQLLSKHLPILFRQLSHHRDDVVSLNFYGRDGRIIYSYPEPAISRSIAQPFREEWFEDKAKAVWIVENASAGEAAEVPLVTLGQQVVDERNSSFGIITMSVDIIALLEKLKPESIWGQYAKSLALWIDSDQEVDHSLPVILGVRSPPEAKNWRVARSIFTPPPSYHDEISALLEGRHYGETGYFSIPHEGVQALWTFSSTGIGLGIMNILPEKEALFKIARDPGRLAKWLSLDSLLIVSVLVISMVVIVIYRSRRMLEPFFVIISAFKSLSSGDFSTRLEFGVKDERQMVANAFNSMANQLEDGIRMRQGLAVAEEVQHNFFPQIRADFGDLDIGIRISYSEETGGDYIDVIEGRDGKVCVVVGDVTGHGVGAALLMATVRALIRSRYEVDPDLASTISSVNQMLTADMGDSGRFVTLFILEIDPYAFSLKWVRAGHDPAWLFSREKRTLTHLDGPGIILGLDGAFQYMLNETSEVGRGDIILIGTDGIWETNNPQGEWFGKERVERVLKEHADQTASGLCDTLLETVDRFRAGQQQEDDVSVAIVKLPGY
jgi:sigma-B regulation protein RsbU (phosphoserine phosphatase)